MLKKHMAACLVATAFMTLPALAQTSTAPSTTAPSTTAPSASPSTIAPSSAAAGQFLTLQEGDQWRGSKLVGLNVYGSDNEKIGDINELLLDRQGNLDAVVIGVGGFLGIGEKNVAVPFKSVEFVMEDTRRTASRAPDAPARTDATGSTTAAPADRPATTATTGTGTAAPTAGTMAATDRTAASTSRSAERGYPDHAMVRMSKADLQNAPTFRYVGDTRSDDRSGAARRTDGAASPTPAPRQ